MCLLKRNTTQSVQSFKMCVCERNSSVKKNTPKHLYSKKTGEEIDQDEAFAEINTLCASIHLHAFVLEQVNHSTFTRSYMGNRDW
jgi:hypothetical protein